MNGLPELDPGLSDRYGGNGPSIKAICFAIVVIILLGFIFGEWITILRYLVF